MTPDLRAAAVLIAAALSSAPGAPQGSDESLIAWLQEAFAATGTGPARVQTFHAPLVELSAGAPGGVRLQRDGTEAVFPARPFPIPARATVLEPAEGAIVLEPEDLASVGSRTPPAGGPRFDGAIVLSVERPGAEDAGLLLAQMMQGAARLGAAGLVLVKPRAGRSLYESMLSEAHFDPLGTLPLSGPVPEILTLSAGPELGIELLGQNTFARLSTPPDLEAPNPGFRPWLLDLRVGAWASLGLLDSSGTNVLAFIEGTDPGRRGEVVVLITLRDSAHPAGAALLASCARALSGEGRPKPGVVLAALDPLRGGIPGAAALAGWLDEMGLSASAVIGIGAPGPLMELPLASESLESLARESARASGVALSESSTTRPGTAPYRAEEPPAGPLAFWVRRETPLLDIKSSGQAEGVGEGLQEAWVRTIASIARDL
ncbi:MAG: hypothetical protein ACREAA_12040 [Candidatus Polarisedimenticolia bacterium]